MIGPELTEVLPIFVIPEDVVVAADEHFVTVEASKTFESFSVYDHIAEMINLIRGLDSLVPSLDHGFVHFLDIVPRSKFGNTVVASESANASVSKMCV
jgi:hypothetical protein